ncbi:hypothetical protein ABOM_005443 [Aspergillus bombycis]|uniref:Uncharacterized protein n=1 Tax=Aspergillus bombycis TaxID=109264 RepID=A0A1F8A1S4_9EURO|nr:hypothetical protein ABOM_005443 [Aspergillus bombycis]OGM45672.1 hypothetical protein ABOM_005443 [Aspergillus bombycis]
MEGCPGLIFSAFSTAAILLFTFLPILLMFYVIQRRLLYRIEVLMTSMTDSVTPEACQGIDGVSHPDKASPDAPEVTVSPAPESRRSSNLMDSRLEDIQVPALLPQITKKMPGPITTSAIVKLSEELHLGEPTPLLDGGLDHLQIPTLDPKRKSLFTASVAHVAKTSTFGAEGQSGIVPWDGKIRWAIEGPSVFDDEEDELGAFYFRPNLLSRHPFSDIWMFQYGLRYVPAKGDSNVYRTVRIESLPSTLTLKDILPAVSGEVFSARLTDTIPIVGSNTAIVTFVWQSDAVRFAQASRSGMHIGPAVAKVVPVNTPTYPISAELKKLIFKEGYTRCLCVSNLRESLKSEVRRVMEKSVHSDYIERIEDGLVLGETYIRFHSIKVAAAAYDQLRNHSCFTKCAFRFLKKASDMRSSVAGERTFGAKVQEARPRIGIWD